MNTLNGNLFGVNDFFRTGTKTGTSGEFLSTLIEDRVIISGKGPETEISSAFAWLPKPVPTPAPAAEKDLTRCRTEPKDRIIESMLKDSRTVSQRAKDAIMDTLSIYNEKTLGALRDSGLKLVVASDDNMALYTKLRSASAYYQPGAKELVMRKSYLEDEAWTKIRQVLKNIGSIALGEIPWGDDRSTLIHEAGHAIDDIFLKDGALSSNAPEIRKLYESYKKNGRRWSFYAKSKDDVAEYVAEGHRMFSQSRKSNLELQTADPVFYQWIKARMEGLYDGAYLNYLQGK